MNVMHLSHVGSIPHWYMEKLSSRKQVPSDKKIGDHCF